MHDWGCGRSAETPRVPSPDVAQLAGEDGVKRRAGAHQRCSACGERLDSSYVFYLDRAGHSYCCACYLTHDTSGKRFGARAEVLRVMTPAGMLAPWKDETAQAPNTASAPV